MPYLHASTNVGSLGGIRRDGSDPEMVAEVRRNLYNAINAIKQKHAKYPDSFGIQEVGNFEVALAPRFGGPRATDEHVQVLHRGRDVKRGWLPTLDRVLSKHWNPWIAHQKL